MRSHGVRRELQHLHSFSTAKSPILAVSRANKLLEINILGDKIARQIGEI